MKRGTLKKWKESLFLTFIKGEKYVGKVAAGMTGVNQIMVMIKNGDNLIIIRKQHSLNVVKFESKK